MYVSKILIKNFIDVKVVAFTTCSSILILIYMCVVVLMLHACIYVCVFIYIYICVYIFFETRSR